MVGVCYICGDKGFLNALLDCSECSVASAHQYCLGIPPGSIDDTFEWVCDCCSVPMDSESCQFGGVFSPGSVLQGCSGDLKIESRSEIVALPEQPEPLCVLSPIQYHGSSTRDKTSNLSPKHETPLSSFMEHPVSIMQGIVLLVSPSGEVIIDEEVSSSNITRLSKRPASYRAKRELPPLGKTVKSDVSSTGTIELHGLDDFEWNDSEMELSFVTALAAQDQPKERALAAQLKKRARNQAETMLLSAGWTIEYKPRVNQAGKKADRVYVSPQGQVYWSLPRAYKKVERNFKKAKAKKRKVGDGSGNSNLSFKPWSKELLSVFRNDLSIKKNKF